MEVRSTSLKRNIMRRVSCHALRYTHHGRRHVGLLTQKRYRLLHTRTAETSKTLLPAAGTGFDATSAAAARMASFASKCTTRATINNNSNNHNSNSNIAASDTMHTRQLRHARPTTTTEIHPQTLKPQSDIFADRAVVSEALASQSTWKLLRAVSIYLLCAQRHFVNFAPYTMRYAPMILTDRVFGWIVKATFFGHFCAGERRSEVRATMHKLKQSGIGAILDYAAESDVSPADQGPKKGVMSARIYDYEGEAECDKHMDTALESIETGEPSGFVAVKMTALGQPELLRHLSDVIVATRRRFAAFVGVDQDEELHVQGAYMNRTITFEQFHDGLRSVGMENALSEAEKAQLFKDMDSEGTGYIDYMEWLTFLDPKQVAEASPSGSDKGVQKVFTAHTILNIPVLSDVDRNRMLSMLQRLDTLAEAAAQKDMRLLIDAEHTYFQPAIDHAVLYLQRKYNRGDKVTIFGTYQCYLKDTARHVSSDLNRARREGFNMAAKCVRGAYMVQERALAASRGEPSPIFDTIEGTHACFDGTVALMMDHLLENPSAYLMVASHNENSVLAAAQRMTELGIPKRNGGVCFAQLLGMSDPVSFFLGEHRFEVYKYVPYGPWKMVVPYLLRRAQENSSMFGSPQVLKERALLFGELQRRFWNFVRGRGQT